MSFTIGIRREDKNQWERRTPIIPDHVKELKEKHDIDTIAQTSSIRTFSDKDYIEKEATVQEDLSNSPVIFGVKEMPIDFFEENKTYVFFAHVIKGQKYNMPMLKKMMEKKCNLIDYELIKDNKNRRLVFFGHYAGLAGMIDTLWTFGQRMEWESIDTPFKEVKRAIDYKDLKEAKEHIEKIGKKIAEEGLPEQLTPLVVGFAGYGNVSKGAQEILDLMPVLEVKPNQLGAVYSNPSNKLVYKVVFKEEDIVEPVSSESVFDLQEYYDKPHLYRSIFDKYISYLSILMNCIYWDERYPRLITKNTLEVNYTGVQQLQVVGDISIDVNGAIEFTEKSTDPGNPVFIYNPVRDDIIDGCHGEGVAVMAVDTLPCELPAESSKEFSRILMPFIPIISKADYSVDFNLLKLPDEIKKAMILYHGRLTPDYLYINKYL